MFGMRKIIKPNLAEKATFKNLPDLTGAVYFFGKIGGGKTTSLLSIAQKYHDDPRKKYKIFDIWGGDRNEHLYWCFPNDNKGYWNTAKKLLNLDEDGPKQYQVHLIYPYWKSTTPIKLPFDAPNIKSSIFTIPIHSIVAEDLNLAVGLLSENDKYLWRESLEKTKKKDGPRMFAHNSAAIARANQTLYKNFIVPVTKNMLIQSDIASTNFDIVEEMKDRETISVLCLEFVPKEFRLFVLGWIIRQVANALDAGKIKTKNILPMREAAEFFRATDDSLLPPIYKMFRIQLSHFIRMGRRGMHLFLDAQSPRETKGLVDGQQDLTILCKLPAESDREDATAQLYRDNLISKRQIQQLATLEPGQVMFVESGKKAKLRYVFLPRTLFWKPGYGDFYENVWKPRNGNIKNFEEHLSEIEKKFEDEKNHIAELKAIEEMKKKKAEEDKKNEKLEVEKLKIEREEKKLKVVEAKKDLLDKQIDIKINGTTPEVEVVKPETRIIKNKKIEKDFVDKTPLTSDSETPTSKEKPRVKVNINKLVENKQEVDNPSFKEEEFDFGNIYG